MKRVFANLALGVVYSNPDLLITFPFLEINVEFRTKTLLTIFVSEPVDGLGEFWVESPVNSLAITREGVVSTVPLEV